MSESKPTFESLMVPVALHYPIRLWALFATTLMSVIYLGRVYWLAVRGTIDPWGEPNKIMIAVLAVVFAAAAVDHLSTRASG